MSKTPKPAMSTTPKPFERTIASETRAAFKDLVPTLFASVIAALYVGALTHSPIVGVLALLGVLGASLRPAYRRVHGAAAYTINASFNLIGLGKLTEASRLLDDAEADPHFEWVRRLVDVQRAIIAMRRGDMAGARDRLDAAIARPIGLLEKANSLYQIEGARALRAFARASLGDREGALEDINEVRQRPGASLDALAKVALAEALVLERAGERARLKELLDREETLLLENTHPRERAIVRGLQRMLRASSKASIYRQTAPSEGADEGRDEPPLADWVAKIAPDVAPFVRVPRRSTDGSPAMIAASAAVAPRPDAVRAVAAAHAARAKPSRSALWMWGPLGAVGLAVIGALGLAVRAIQAPSVDIDGLFPSAGSTSPLLWLIPLIAVSVGSVAVISIQQTKRARERRQARARSRSRGAQVVQQATSPEAANLSALAMGEADVPAAQARLLLAGVAERRGDFTSAVTECRLGIGRLESPKSRAEADILYPDLIALAAFALAATGRSDEADAELALLSPMYPHHARAVFRVRLVQAVRKGDIAGAARWVEQGAADLPLSIREELLADVVRALHAPSHAGAGEIERLKDELRRSPERRRWLDTVAPGLVTSFEHGDEGSADESSAEKAGAKAVPDQAALPSEAAAGPRVRVEVEVKAPEGRQAGRIAPSVASSNDAELEARAEAEATEAAALAAPARQRGV